MTRMKSLKNIFTVLFSVAFATTSAFAAQDCRNATYRAAYPEKCANAKSADNNNTFLLLLGGAALVGVGAALAGQSSGDGGSSSTISNQTTFPRLTLTNNIDVNYAQNDKVQNNKISYYYVTGANSADIDVYKLNNIKTSNTYQKNYKQYDNINFGYAVARGFTGKNTTINVVDDFNTYHGNSVYEITHNIANDANITKTNIGASNNALQSYDYIANAINTSGKFDIYNASWQIASNDSTNAATAIYNTQNDIKTYAAAQQYMYDITSYNFITQIRNSAVDNDSIFVWAAGNESETESGALSALPLAFPELNGHFVNVVALDNNNNLAWYSNQCGITQNYCIAAPGSAWDTDASDTKIAGTSFATPVVSGAIATIKEAFPYMKSTEITKLLFVTAKDLGETGVDSVYGWGLLDMERATRPVGEAKIILANETVQPLNLSNVSGPAATAVKNANVQIAFVDDFGRAFTTNLSNNINVVPYGRGFEKLTESDNDTITLFDTMEFGFKQNHMLESSGLISVKSNSLTNFVGYKNTFDIKNVHFYQNARLGVTNPTADENSLISGFSNIYTASLKMGAQFDKLSLEVAIPETIISGNMYMNLPVNMDNNGKLIYNNTAIDMTSRPSTEYTVKYGALSATFVDNPDYQNELFIMAKTKFAF